MSKGSSSDEVEWSMFQMKYAEFVEDALGALPEYEQELKASLALGAPTRIARFQQEVGLHRQGDAAQGNPGTVLPGVTLSDVVWNALSDGSREAIWEHVRVLSVCCLMETGHTADEKPEWMEEMMGEMKKKWESVDMESLMKKFSTFFSAGGSKETGDSTDSKETGDGKEEAQESPFPKLPERFLKGQLAKLAQEIVKDITPEDLGISADKAEECEKNPSRAFGILFSTFTQNPLLLQKTIAKIGKRLQQKIASGAIRPQEIAKEAEELMKEFSTNSAFVEMMEGLKGAFGMEDMDTARKAGKESSARMSIVRDRLRKKLEKKAQTQVGSTAATATATATAATASSTASTATATATASTSLPSHSSKKGAKKSPQKKK